MDNGAVVAKKDSDLDRSPKWPGVQKAHLKLEPKCVACGGIVLLQVHHVVPFHFCIVIANRPDLELDHRNLITLCQDPKTDHHLLVGHEGNFQTYNPDVRRDAKACNSWLKRLMNTTLDAMRLKKRPKTLAQMTVADKAAFVLRVNKLYPLPGKVSPTSPTVTLPKP